MTGYLTEQERTFALGYLQEQWDGVKGPAFTWIEEHGIAHREFQPFTLSLSEELGRGAPVPPPEGQYSAPWPSVEDFRARSAELQERMNCLMTQTRADENTHRTNT